MTIGRKQGAWCFSGEKEVSLLYRGGVGWIDLGLGTWSFGFVWDLVVFGFGICPGKSLSVPLYERGKIAPSFAKEGWGGLPQQRNDSESEPKN